MYARVRSAATRRFLWLLALTLVVATGLLLQGPWSAVPALPGTITPAPVLPEPPARLLPFEYWAHRRTHPAAYAQAQLLCSALPGGPTALAHAAAGWQHLALAAGNLYLYAAHWDPRPLPLHGAEGLGPRVAVLVYCDVEPLPNITCLLWYENQNAPCEVPATATYGWQTGWGGPQDTVNEPYVLACDVRPDCGAGRVPRAVSLTAGACPSAPSLNAGACPSAPSLNAGACPSAPSLTAGACPPAPSLTAGACPPAPATLLAVQGAPSGAVDAPSPPPTSVAVCVKWLDYRSDRSANLVEWVELVRALGADTIYIYVLQVHPNMQRVLRHYEESGLVDVTWLQQAPRRRERAPAAERAFTALRRELLPLNDCLYRAAAARRHAWLGVFDLDELIVPLKDATWGALIARQLAARNGSSVSVDSLVFLNYFFLGKAQREAAAPPPAHMLAHVWRAAHHNEPGDFVKSFFNVSSVVAMHNHSPMSCGVRHCSDWYVPPEDGRLQHYRERCAFDAADCPELHRTVRDAALPARWGHVLPAARKVLRLLDLPLAAPPE